MASAAQVEAFRSNTGTLVRLAHRDLRDFWAALDVAGNPLRVKTALLDFYPLLIESYGDAAAVLGADFYDELRQVPPSASRFAAVIADTVTADQAEASARWALGPLFATEPDPGQVLRDLLGATQRLVLQPARDSVFNSARRDPVRTGFARVPRGAKTCRFCTMIASRGAVYGSASSAGESNRWHDACDCAIVPVRSRDDFPDGYDPGTYMAAYAEGVGVGRTD